MTEHDRRINKALLESTKHEWGVLYVPVREARHGAGNGIKAEARSKPQRWRSSF